MDSASDPHRQTVDIRPPGRWPDLDLGDTWRYRAVLIALVRRSILGRYAGSGLGLWWMILQPLMMSLILTLFFGILRGTSYDGVPWSLFYLVALAVWTPMLKTWTDGANSLISNASIMGRVYFPRAHFPLAAFLATVPDLLVQIPIVLLFMIWFGVPVPTTAIAIPMLIAIGYTTTLGLGFLFSGAQVRNRDIGLAMSGIERIWFFITPILYQPDIVPPDLLPLYYLNPMALVITGMRWSLLGTAPPPAYAWALATGASLSLLLIGYFQFRRLASTAADYVA